MDKKKMTTKEKVFLICCVAIGLIIGLWLANRLYSPVWQNQEDEEIELHKEEGSVDSYILARFVMSLRPDGQTRYVYQSSGGEAFSYQDLYDYASHKLGYECKQLKEYSDHTPYNEMAECHKI